MQEFLKLVGGFSLAAILSYAVTSLILLPARLRKLAYVPRENSKVRFKTETNLYRSRFLGANEEGWLITSPLSRDHFVALDLGTPITVEITTERGMLNFQSQIVARYAEDGTYLITKPGAETPKDRRTVGRSIDMSDQRVILAGKPARLLDRSSKGIRASLELPASDKTPFATEGQMLEIKFDNGEVRTATVVDTDRSLGETIIRLVYSA